MVDFDFYANTYLGSAIPEKAFPAMALRATQALSDFRRTYQVLPTDIVSEKMALCAMAEVLYGASRHEVGVTAATVGSVSVRYGRIQIAACGESCWSRRKFTWIFTGGRADDESAVL